MKKHIKFLLILLAVAVSCSEKSGYTKLNKSYTVRENLIKNIKPNIPILYWKYVWTISNKAMYEFGDSNLLKKYKVAEPNYGFFPECFPGMCYSYIMYIDKNGINYVTNEQSLRKFIGRIDNVSEAILIGRTEGLGVDSKNAKGGSYKKTKTGFKLNMAKSKKCPIEYESILFEIDFNGKYKMKSNGVYKTLPGCIIS
ncbi:hypothetical protein VB776_10685 [Arcicella sp. DC2W]|uniref:Lipoprotein n=1 Tax=Arcicella gelida TaxID=2984195 RepID=A0ABU5S4F7_9BACT|nr:hypothetical protein [Arcicella sp. DC2W]MEA5403384.1 hypothetical protein [Arcicella sp. DC2W]